MSYKIVEINFDRRDDEHPYQIIEEGIETLQDARDYCRAWLKEHYDAKAEDLHTLGIDIPPESLCLANDTYYIELQMQEVKP